MAVKEKCPASCELAGLISESPDGRYLQYKRNPEAVNTLYRFPPHYAVFGIPALVKPNSCTRDMRRQTASIRKQIEPYLQGYKKNKKLDIASQLAIAGLKAYHFGYTIRAPRDCKKASRIEVQVADAMIAAGLFHPYISKPNDWKETRYMPTPALAECFTSTQVRKILGQDDGQYVQLLTRKTLAKEAELLPIDMSNPTFADVQDRLQRVNAVNARYVITYQPLGIWIDDFLEPRRTIPIHVAKFTQMSDGLAHGRIYTDKRGHQRLRKVERRTIRFDASATVELDFDSLHPRMVYHLKGLECRMRYNWQGVWYDVTSPYALWGPCVKDSPHRVLAKLALNTLLNARNRVQAEEALKQKESLRTKTGQAKEFGTKAYETAVRIQEARKQTGLSFKNVIDRIYEVHGAIEDCFCSDMGMKVLMLTDSRIALDVMTAFADCDLPILGVHDSFITLRAEEDRLRREMVKAYKKHVSGFEPVID